MSGERVVICLVCGKKFPRGVLDLARHTTAITLQHLISNRQKAGFDFHCNKCDLYFTAKAHLELHQQSICPVKSKQKSLTNVSPVSKPKVKKEVLEEETEADDDLSEKTEECVICGKLFPRGPIDLARHQTAITLKHLVHPRHTASYHYGCKRCGSHFTTAEHLAMHTELSTCNPDMVWPPTVAPGSKCITRAELAELEAAEAAGPLGSVSSENGDHKGKVAKDVAKKAATPAKTIPEADTLKGKLPKRTATAVAATPTPPPLSKYKLNQLMLREQQQLQQQQQPASAGPGRRARDTTDELYFPKTKRAKVIVPEDRKAFFAVVSLLIDAEEVPEGEKLTEENYEAYLPPQHKKLVDALKATLYCTC